MKLTSDIRFGNLTTSILPAYNQSNLNIGPRFIQENGTGENHFVGPSTSIVSRLGSHYGAIIDLIDVVEWSNNISWIFIGDNSTATATRRVYFAVHDKIARTITARGSIILTYPPTTNHTIRGLRAAYNKYTTGTASVSGTAVTGTGTAWATDRMSVGSRIGFGTTDPSAVTEWYEISAVGSDTSITLTTSAGTIGNGPYVIEDLQILTATSNATVANGGLFVAKGLRIELFHGSPGVSKTIPAATTTDNLRAVYWLADAATVLNTVAGGCVIDPDFTSWTDQRCYVIDNTNPNTRVYLYNYRAALAGLASGKSTSAFIHRTGATAPVGTMIYRNNGVVATTSHGPGSGVKCLYFITGTNVYRSPVSDLTNGGTGWLADTWTPTYPGSSSQSSLNPQAYAFSSIDYNSLNDVFYITSSVGLRDLVSQYKTSGEADRFMFIDDGQSDSLNADSSGVVHPTILYAGTSLRHIIARGGYTYYFTRQTVFEHSLLYAVPSGAGWHHADANNDFIVSPRLATPGASKLYNIYVNDIKKIGAATFSIQPEPWDLYYRTSGISDNSGAWTFIQGHGDLSAADVTEEIQFKMVFRVEGGYGVMNRLHNLTVVYEGTQQLDSRYRWSFADTNQASNIWGFTQIEYFYKTPPVHKITIRRADTDAIVLTQASTGTTNGEFEYWTGTVWAAGLDTDTKGKRRRFRATAALPAVDLYAELVVV